MENKNVGQVLPDNKEGKAAVLKGTPSSVPVLQPTGQALLTGYLPTHGEAASFNTSSTLSERAECVSTGMRGKATRGFTLIELLVVVLIIGILSAVALPQYQKVIRRNRFLQFQIEARQIFESLDMYYLRNGEPPKKVGDLDVWDRVSEDKNSGYLNGRRYFAVAGYFRTYVSLPGVQMFTCDFWVFNSRNPWGECYAYDTTGKQFLEQLGWRIFREETNGMTRYYIPKKGF